MVVDVNDTDAHDFQSSLVFSCTTGLMKSVFTLVKENATLRLVSLRAGICFGCFLTLWACLAFKMSGAPFYAGNNVIGMLGLCGIAGAMTASFVGKFVRILGIRMFNYIGCSIMILSWLILYFFQDSYIGIIAGIILIDIGMQCVQISNQTCALSLVPQASNRVNTIFMTTYFLGGSLGTFLAGTFWHQFGWAGVTGVGICLASCSLLITAFSKH
jgi:predicted MFS family arabinose efflux permease